MSRARPARPAPRDGAAPPVSPASGARRERGARRPESRPHAIRRRARLLRDLESWSEGPIRVLSFAWLLVIVGQLLRPSSRLLVTFGTAIWAVFILDFALRFALAPEKRAFLRRNWFSALALVIPALRLLRVVAVLRFATLAGGGQLMMVLGTINRTMNALRVSLGRRQVAFVFALTAVVLLLGAAGMLRLEPHAAAPGAPGFAGYGDALWWTAMLMTTIGSAYWPITPAGRILAFLLSLYSLAVFGYITAVLASFFVGQDASKKDGPVAGANDIAALRSEIRALRDEILASRLADGAERPS